MKSSNPKRKQHCHGNKAIKQDSLNNRGNSGDFEQTTDVILSLPDFLVNMSASADVLAQAKVEIALGAIPEGKNVRVSIRHLTRPIPVPSIPI